VLDVVRRNPGYRRIWLSQVVSQAGDWLGRMAVLVVIGRLGGEVAGVGALYGGEIAARLLPTSVMSSIAGPLADRLPRRLLMVLADLLRATIVLGLLLIRDPAHLPWLYALVLAQMSVSIFFESARSASVPSTVPARELHEAYALSAATWSTMLSIGSLFGGLLVDWIGTDGVFLVDAVSYVVSALLLIGLRLPPPPKHPAPLRVMDILTARELRDGWRHVCERRLRSIVMAKGAWGGAGGFLVLLSVTGSQRFATPELPAATAIGLLFAARGVGTGLGPVLARRWFGSSPRVLYRQIVAGFAVGAGGYLAFSFCASFPAAIACVVLAHCGGSALWVSSTTLWQLQVDDRFRGRIYALEFLAMTLAFSLGGILTGLLYDATGSIDVATWASCAAVAVSGIVWTVCSRRPGGDC
jgi:MFS family permease